MNYTYIHIHISLTHFYYTIYTSIYEIKSFLFLTYKLCCTGFQAALEGRAVINLQMSDFYAALQDINASIDVCRTAELYTNRGVIYQVRAYTIHILLHVLLAV